MKKVVCIVLVLLICVVAANAEHIVSYPPTTGHEICFNGFSMGISHTVFKKKLEDMGIDFKEYYSDYGDAASSYSYSSSSYGDGKIIPVYYCDCVETRVYEIQSNDLLGDLFKVAGHGVNRIEASFFTGRSKIKGGLYEIEIHISDNDLISPDEQYADLEGKLTKLYGEPYTYDDDSYNAVTRVSVWIGSKDTAVYLKKWKFSNGLESVYLVYGLCSSNLLFSEKEAEYEAELEQKKNDALDSIADDYSGL